VLVVLGKDRLGSLKSSLAARKHGPRNLSISPSSTVGLVGGLTLRAQTVFSVITRASHFQVVCVSYDSASTANVLNN
jgi:hypothetical protein